jgi:hypothetical protein
MGFEIQLFVCPACSLLVLTADFCPHFLVLMSGDAGGAAKKTNQAIVLAMHTPQQEADGCFGDARQLVEAMKTQGF